MKEYLSLPEKQDETREAPENSEYKANSAEENTNPDDSVLGTEENGHGAIECSKDETKLEKDCTSQSSSTVVRQFKNIVAIVDPPRVGLHPTVSDYLRAFLCICSLISYLSWPPSNCTHTHTLFLSPSNLLHLHTNC